MSANPSRRSHQPSLPGFGTDEPSSETTAADPKTVPTPAQTRDRAADPPANLPDDLTGKTVWVVDSHSLIFQVFHALPEMSSPSGEPVNAIYGFTRDLFYLIEEKQPDFLICAFDMPGKTFRHTLYDQYKANRGEMPEDLRAQLPELQKVVAAMRIPILQLTDYEADDLLATVARRVAEQGGECTLVTGDKDCRQLINDRVCIYNIRKNQCYGAEALSEDWGIRPDQVVDFQALVGDSVDNVPGVALIGPKLARQLLETYDTLDNVLEHAEEVSGKKRKQNLLEGRQIAMLSRELVRLVDDVQIEIDWSAAQVGDFDSPRLSELFNRFGFRTFGEKVKSENVSPQPALEVDYRTVDTIEGLRALVAEMQQQPLISIDTETTSLSSRAARIVGISCSWQEGQGYYIPIQAPSGERVIEAERAFEILRPVLESEQIKKIGQNLKYDIVVFASSGLRLAGVEFDTMVASYLLASGERNHNLDDMASRFLNHTTSKISDLIGKGKNQKSMADVPVTQISDYAAEDADIPLRLRSILADQLEEAGLSELFRTVELPLVDVLAEMEFTGIRVDVDRLNHLSDQFGIRIDQLQQEIFAEAGHEFNIASPKQLQVILFEERKLPVIKKTKTGASTDASVLEELARIDPLPAKIIEYRQYTKLKSTYVDSLPKMIYPGTGRVHASFNQVVTATGRLSSSDPNLQNIPIRSEAGREIRSAFVPGEPGWKLLAADYSQIELRVLAHFCQDETLCRAFDADEDIHACVAAEVFGVEIGEVSSAQRRSAKAVNFGVIYGQSAFGLAKSLNIDQSEAAEFIDAYFARYAEVEGFMLKILLECRETGFVKTILGRRRAINGIRDGDALAKAGRQRNMAERTAINTVIQGSAADLIKMAMLNIHRRLKKSDGDARMLLQIHDELVFEAPDGQIPELAQLVDEEMSSVMRLSVPLKVDVKCGHNWADCEPLAP